jgi:DNA polymerase-1
MTNTSLQLFPRFVLIDGSALAYRNHFAFSHNPLINSRGEHTSAIYGFVNSLLSILDKEQPDYLAVVFDAPGLTHRHQLYEAYKANREQMPDELSSQLPRLKELLVAMGIKVIEQEGIEADDLIGGLALWAAKRGWLVWIVSNDKDFAQLVDHHISIYAPSRKATEPEILGPKQIREKYGVKPTQMVDYFALVGDTSDNIPGVPQIGPKTAAKLLSDYEDLDQIYANLEQIQPKLREQLSKHRDLADLSRQLVAIQTDLPFKFAPTNFVRQEMQIEALRQLFRELEFHKLSVRLLGELEPTSMIGVEKAYLHIDSVEHIERLVELIRREQKVAIASLYFYTDQGQRCMGLGFSCEPHTGYYLSLRPDASIVPERSLGILKELLEDPNIAKIGHDLKETWISLAKRGICLAGIEFDTMLADHLLNPTRDKGDLAQLALHYLQLQMSSEDDILGMGRQRRSWQDIIDSTCGEYACEQADVALQVADKLRELLVKTERVSLLAELDLPLIPILAQMECTGIAVNMEHLETLRLSSTQQLEEINSQILKWAGDPEFNVQSPQQVGQLLFDKLMLHNQFGIDIPKTPKTGNYRTDSETLEALTPHELTQLILSYREVQKRLSTYLEPLLQQAQKDQHNRPIIYTRFRQTGTVTGRLSSFSPNLQNIPVRTEEGREIRKAFVPKDEGWLLLSADYSQIELRILAHISQDPELRRAFAEGIDIHTRTASLIFGVFPQLVTPQQRTAAKAINFGVIFGLGPPRLSKEIGSTVNEAGRFIKAYFQTYPGVKRYLKTTVAEARQHKFVETLFGRRREIPHIDTKIAKLRAQAEHIAVNTPIQGTAADLLKKAMISIACRLQTENYQARLLLQIHDELLFEAPADELERLAEMVSYEMIHAHTFDVPLVVSINTAKNWADAH